MHNFKTSTSSNVSLCHFAGVCCLVLLQLNISIANILPETAQFRIIILKHFDALFSNAHSMNGNVHIYGLPILLHWTVWSVLFSVFFVWRFGFFFPFSQHITTLTHLTNSINMSNTNNFHSPYFESQGSHKLVALMKCSSVGELNQWCWFFCLKKKIMVILTMFDVVLFLHWIAQLSRGFWCGLIFSCFLSFYHVFVCLWMLVFGCLCV